MDDKLFEENKLVDIIKKYERSLEDTKVQLKNVYFLYRDNEEREIQRTRLESKIYTLSANVDKPYFARIDFENINKVKNICYIGKIGVSDEDNNVVVVDWRAPFASVYYDSNLGLTNYKVKDETIEGSLLLKRQYNIQNKKLIDFTDVDTVSNDELLKPYLGVSADARLKNIVSTIQKEQNEVIRSSIYKNMIVQGVAGSGKTTVALHRIAYLAYTYRDQIKNNQYMIIGPNKFFVNYISSVLPDLDVKDVMQYDLIELTEKYTHEEFLVEDEMNTINNYLNGHNSNLPKIKTSILFKQVIDNYFKNYSNNIIKDSLKIKDFVVIPKNILKSFWHEASEKDYDNIQSTVSRCILLLEKYIKENETDIIHRLNDFIDNKLKEANMLDKCRKERDFIRNEIKTNIKNVIKNYFNPSFKKSTFIYKDLIKNISHYTDNPEIINNITYSIKHDDLTALLYINYKIYGSDDYKKIQHVVIDEAQDYNDFTFYTLSKIFPCATFSIYGDIAQSIYSYRSLDNWEEVNQNVFNNTLNIKYLNKSYRTSIEIMNEANKINKYLNLPIAEAVIRHGDPVKYIKTDDISSLIDKLIKDDMKTIAIISRTNTESNSIYESLKDKYNINNITDKNQEYKGGICTITSHLSKGLEFDAVIISNIDTYNKNNVLDMKLLYVSMTRPLHKLYLLYKNELLDILKDTY